MYKKQMSLFFARRLQPLRPIFPNLFSTIEYLLWLILSRHYLTDQSVNESIDWRD